MEPKNSYVGITKFKKKTCGCAVTMQGFVTENLKTAQSDLQTHRDIFVRNLHIYSSIVQTIEVYDHRGELISIMSDIRGE